MSLLLEARSRRALGLPRRLVCASDLVVPLNLPHILLHTSLAADYSNFLNPELGKCSDRFFSQFEQVYYCKPIGAGRGWLFRVYGEPWQLHRQSREDLTLIETYDERPTPAECVERLKQP